MALLEQPTGGLRTIGVFASYYRVWALITREEDERWGHEHRRPFFAASKGSSAEGVVWRIAMRAEAS
eukprot:4521439-Lingulodinium_polyedra.AAC.1